MLKVANILNDYSSDKLEYDRLLGLLQGEVNSKFKWDGDERILYKLENKNSIEEELGIEFPNYEQTLLDFTEEFYINDDFVTVFNNFQIEKSDCFNAIENFFGFEDRIWNAGDDWDSSLNETDRIIKEHAIVIFNKAMNDGLEKIKDGSFEWK